MKKLRAVAILCFLGCALSFSLAIYINLLTQTFTVPIDALEVMRLSGGELETRVGVSATSKK